MVRTGSGVSWWSSCSSVGARVSTFADLSKVDVAALVSPFWSPWLCFYAVTRSMMFRACAPNFVKLVRS